MILILMIQQTLEGSNKTKNKKIVKTLTLLVNITSIK